MALAADRGPPSGTVTFLFTDVEASTRLMTLLGDEYPDLLDQHDALLRAVWARHDGYEINTGGDAFYMAFASADDALCAAVHGQQAIGAASWPKGQQVRVRMGVHTGFARPRDGDYAALAVNRTARVVGAAHGGQILVSAETVEALDAPPVLPLVPLGRFRVRDFDTPPLLYRVEAGGWTDPGRQPRVQPAEGHNLSRPLTQLVGRDEDRAWLEAQVGPSVLVTLVGQGGIGKTRLAIEVGLALVDRWPDGVWFVDLAPVRAGERLANEFATAVGAPQTPGVPSFEDVRRHLEDREALLIVDNCEHLSDAVAQTVHDVMVACPRLGVLATSRTPLGLREEVAHRLGPLSAASDDSPAVALFLDRASGLRDDDLPAVRQLCSHLDGLPLALELAAARTTAMRPALILDGLHRIPGLLRSTDPTLPERHRSLERVLDWSWELLNEPARTALRRLAVLAGSFDLELAGVACTDGTDISDRDVPELFWELLDHSLVRSDQVAGASRFHLPVSVRVYARGRTDLAETHRTVGSLARHYEETLGPERAIDRRWLSTMAIELDNLRGVVQDLVDVDQPLAQALAWSVGHYHDVTGAYATGVGETIEHLALLPADHPNRVGLLTLLADLHMRMGQVDLAATVLTEAETLAGSVASPTWNRVGLRRAQGALALRRGDHDRAAVLGRAMLAEASTPRDRSRAWNHVGLVHALAGDATSAIQAFEQDLASARVAGMEWFLATAHSNLAESHLQMGQRVSAAEHQLACLDLARDNGDPLHIAFSVMVAARLLAEDNQWPRAITLHRAALDALQIAGWALFDSDAKVSATLIADARDRLSDAAFERAEADGRAMPIDDAAEAADAVLRDVIGHAPGP